MDENPDNQNGEEEDEEEAEEVDPTRARVLRMLENQRRYLEVCNHSAHLLQMLSRVIPGVPEGNEESGSDEGESTSGDNTPDWSEASTPRHNNTDGNSVVATTTHSDNPVLWTEPIMSCQVIHTGSSFMPDVRRPPVGCGTGCSLHSAFSGPQRSRWRTGLPLHVAMGLGLGRTVTASSDSIGDGSASTGDDSGGTSREEDSAATHTLVSVLPDQEHSKSQESKLSAENLPRLPLTSCAETQTTPVTTLHSIYPDLHNENLENACHESKSGADDGGGGDNDMSKGSNVCKATRSDINSAIKDLNDAAMTIQQARQMLSTFNIGSEVNNNNHISKAGTNQEKKTNVDTTSHEDSTSKRCEEIKDESENDSEDDSATENNGFPRPLLVKCAASDETLGLTNGPREDANDKASKTEQPDISGLKASTAQVGVLNSQPNSRLGGKCLTQSSTGDKTGTSMWSNNLRRDFMSGRLPRNFWTRSPCSQNSATDPREHVMHTRCQAVPLPHAVGLHEPVPVENANRVGEVPTITSLLSSEVKHMSKGVPTPIVIKPTKKSDSCHNNRNIITLDQLRTALRTAVEKLRSAGVWNDTNAGGGGEKVANFTAVNAKDITLQPKDVDHSDVTRAQVNLPKDTILTLKTVCMNDGNMTNNKFDSGSIKEIPLLRDNCNNGETLGSKIIDEKSDSSRSNSTVSSPENGNECLRRNCSVAIAYSPDRVDIDDIGKSPSQTPETEEVQVNVERGASEAKVVLSTIDLGGGESVILCNEESIKYGISDGEDIGMEKENKVITENDMCELINDNQDSSGENIFGRITPITDDEDTFVYPSITRTREEHHCLIPKSVNLTTQHASSTMATMQFAQECGTNTCGSSLSSLDNDEVTETENVDNDARVTDVIPVESVKPSHNEGCSLTLASQREAFALPSAKANNPYSEISSRITCIDLEGTTEIECCRANETSFMGSSCYLDTCQQAETQLRATSSRANFHSQETTDSVEDIEAQRKKLKSLTATDKRTASALMEKLSRLQEEAIPVPTSKQRNDFVSSLLRRKSEVTSPLPETTVKPPPPTPEFDDKGLSVLIKAHRVSKLELIDDDVDESGDTEYLTAKSFSMEVSDSDDVAVSIAHASNASNAACDIIAADNQDVEKTEGRPRPGGFRKLLRRFFKGCIPSKKRTS